MGIIWVIILCFFSYTQGTTPLLAHTYQIKADQKTQISCSDTQEIITTRLPQQCIKLNGSAKPFRYIYPVSRKGHYIKVTSNKNIYEFIIRKENCPEELKRLLAPKEQKGFGNNSIVRFYKKNTDNNRWSPIATISEQYAHKIISKTLVLPDGSIQL